VYDVQELRRRLQADLKDALKTRDGSAVVALRCALAAIANAEAVPAPDTRYDPVINRPADVPRRDLTMEQAMAVLRTEADERRRAIVEYDGLGQVEHAARLRAELAVLGRYLPEAS